MRGRRARGASDDSDVSVLIGGVFLAAGVMLFILEPVFSGRSAPRYDGDDDYDEGATRRRVALTALRDLEYDRATGKLDERDYAQLRTELSREALEHLGTQEGEVEADGLQVDRASRELEAEVAQLRRAIREGMECGSCRHLNRLGARFCGRCGKGLGGTRGGPGDLGGNPRRTPRGEGRGERGPA